MSEEVKTISVLIMAIAVLGYAYLFSQAGETFIVLILLFIGVVMALSLVKGITIDKKRR